MKIYETHFNEYINKNEIKSLHPKMNKIYNDSFPLLLNDLKNIIFYGPSGIGKYTQMLCSIKKYSLSNLKYEKKISILFNKQQYFFKISDIHYEIDMSLLGCNSKLLWHEIYQQIIDSIIVKPTKSGIIVCTQFQEIHGELLENFYSYMQHHNSKYSKNIKLIFIIISQELSFIPENIINCCQVINLSRPNATTYNNCFKNKLNQKIKSVETITNIKNIYDKSNIILMASHKIICNKIIDNILNVNELKFLKFRDLLYDIFIYNLNITNCIWYILNELINKQHINSQQLSKILVKTYIFFQYYNNNYRPIYHVESYFYFLISIIHNYAI
jgi:hypothetical protein